MTDADLERRTQAYGHEIFARIDRQGPLPLSPAWFDDKLMNLTMSEEALKVQLFRFIDALPLLHDPESISAHLREYLEAGGQRLPWWVRWGTRLIPRRGFWAGSLAWAARWNAEHLARRFIAGSNVAEALATIRRLRQSSLAFTVDLLGEATITEAEAEARSEAVPRPARRPEPRGQRWPEIPLIDRDDRGPMPRVNVSVKLSALYSQFDPIDPEGTSRGVRRRLRPILRSAPQPGVRQLRHGAVRVQGPDAAIFREILDEAGVPRLAGRRHRHPGVSERHRRRPEATCSTGRSGAARPSGCGWSRGRTGTTRRSSPPQKAGRCRSSPRSGRRDANFEQLSRVPAREPSNGCGRRSAATTSAASPTPWRWPSDWTCRRGATSSRCSTAWPTPIKDALVVAGPARPRLHALRPAAAGHGLPRPPAAGEHLERVVPAGQLQRRTCPRRSC